MKFTHQLKFNSVPEWREHYIQYAHLKKYIYALAKKEADLQAGAPTIEEGPLAPLLQDARATQGPSEEGFQRELDAQLAALLAFFAVKEADLLAKVSGLELDVQSLEKIPGRREASTLSRLGITGGPCSSSDAIAPGAAVGATVAPLTTLTMDASPSTLDLARMVTCTPPQDHRKVRVKYWENPPRSTFSPNLNSRKMKLQGRFQDLYIGLHDLRQFLIINKEGFRKIIKKHDKLTRMVDLRDCWWPNVEAHLAPTTKQQELDRAIADISDHYAVVYTGGDVAKAEEQLSRGLREHITFERNTVWRDMAAMERKYAAVSVKQAAPPGGAKASRLRDYLQWTKLALSCAVFAILLNVDVWPGPQNGPRNNCLALLVFASLLWSLEAVPLFVTSMAIPFLVVTLEVLTDGTKDPPQRLTPQQAASVVFHAMFSQTVMLLLGGFSIAAALSKHAIAKQVAVTILSRVGRRPRNVLLAAMFTATFASMWISNVAAPVLCFGLVQPILRTLNPGHPFAKALVMGIALASNVGGMTSPISSPQNIFAIERMSMDGHPPSWLSWFAVALPVSIIINLVCWALLLLVYQPERYITEVRRVKPNTDPVNGTQVYIVIVSLLTVVCWCGNSYLQRYTGEMGIIAIVPLVAFFGFGVLNKDDFNSFLWNVVMLAMGGLSLGEAVKSSGLLAALALDISNLVTGLSLWQVAAVFFGMVLVATTFISHTVGAMVILPIVQSVGEAMASPTHPKLLVMGAALMCSGAMGLPVSGFPNMNAVSLEDSTGNAIVSTKDFLLVGVPSSFFAYLVIVTLGYVLMLLVGL